MTETKGLASILILTKDNPFLIRSCLESLLLTVPPSQTEILLGDTGSTNPEVFDLYDQFGKRYEGTFEVVKLEKYHFHGLYGFRLFIS